MTPSDLVTISELARGSIAAVLLEHLRMTRPTQAEGLHRTAWNVFRLAFAGLPDWEMRVPALPRGGDDLWTVGDLARELRLEALLGWPPAASEAGQAVGQGRGEGAAPPDGKTPAPPPTAAGDAGADPDPLGGGSSPRRR